MSTFFKIDALDLNSPRTLADINTKIILYPKIVWVYLFFDNNKKLII